MLVFGEFSLYYFLFQNSELQGETDRSIKLHPARLHEYGTGTRAQPGWIIHLQTKNLKKENITHIKTPNKNLCLTSARISFHHSKKQQLPCNCVFFFKRPDDSPSNFRGQKVPHGLFHQKITPNSQRLGLAAARFSHPGAGAVQRTAGPGGLGQPNIPWKHVFFQAWVKKGWKNTENLGSVGEKSGNMVGWNYVFFCPPKKKEDVYFPIPLNVFVEDRERCCTTSHLSSVQKP